MNSEENAWLSPLPGLVIQAFFFISEKKFGDFSRHFYIITVFINETALQDILLLTGLLT